MMKLDTDINFLYRESIFKKHFWNNSKYFCNVESKSKFGIEPYGWKDKISRLIFMNMHKKKSWLKAILGRWGIKDPYEQLPQQNRGNAMKQDEPYSP